MDTNQIVTLATLAVLCGFCCLLPYFVMGGRKD